MGELLNGSIVAYAIAIEVKYEVERLKTKGVIPKLLILKVEEKTDDVFFEKDALKRMKSCGIDCDIKSFSNNVSQSEFIEKLKKFNNDDMVHGILMLTPLPMNIDINSIKYIINPNKDVNCFNPISITEYDPEGFTPCIPTAAIEILKFYDLKIKGKNAVVVGQSSFIGKSAANMLLNEDATVTICHSKTENLEKITTKADILIAAFGRANMISKKYIKKNAVVVDLGTNVDLKGNICGDVNIDDCKDKSGYITSIPEGIGAVSTSILARHVLKACKNIYGLI